MFKNIETKTKILINMVIAQLGFITISTVAILSSGKVTAIIVINILFAIICAYTNFAAMNRIVGGINRFKEYMDDLMDFIFMRTNSIRKATFIKNDEIGLILREMNDYVDNIDKLRKEDMKVLGEIVLSMDKISRGMYNTKISSNSKNFMIRALRESINKMVESSSSNIKDLTTVLNAYANNNYTNKIEIDKKLKDEMLEVMEAINVLGDRLTQNARDNLNNGIIIKENSDDMTMSIKKVANQANQQAASLEETAAALEEITSITKNNTENTNKMADLGKVVKKTLSDGQVLAQKTTSSMDEINDEVASISQAIVIIDQIAFQTNILSLNAAVEAATAGEAGKGFAVVAQEVRNLANRSAQAADEIKKIVENASVKANNGKVISDDMIKGYEDLNTNINETISLIEDVSISSQKQMRGIEQINDTISILDKATQENALEANSVSDIANKMLQISDNLVADAKEKKFNQE